MRHQVSAWLALVFIAVVSNGAAQDVEPKPIPGIPVQNWTVNVFRPLARDIYLRNDDTVDRIIVDLQIYNCENLKQVCQVYTPNLLLPAGKTVKAMRLTPDRTTLPFTYQFTFHSRPANPQMVQSVNAPTPGATANFSRTGPLPFFGLADVGAFRPRVSAPAGKASCVGNAQSPGPAGGPTLMLFFSGNNGDGSSMVYVDLDTRNIPVLYTEVRGAFRGQPGAPGAEGRPPYTILSVRPERQMAELVNEGGNLPSEYFISVGPDLMSAASLGKPADVMARVLRECGSR